MKQTTLSLLIAAASLFTSSAFAQSQPSCDLKFSVQTNTFLIISTGGGHGVVTCYDASANVISEADVDIEIAGIGPGIGSFSLRGIARDIAITAPEQIEGTYFVGQGAIGAHTAVGDVMGFKNVDSPLGFEVDMGVVRGGGLFLSGTHWTITLRE